MILFQLYMIICILFLSGKDAISFLLKEPETTEVTLSRLKNWHLAGFVLNGLFILPFIYFDIDNWWKYLLYTSLLRVIVFNVHFNYQAKLSIGYIGETSWWDKKSSKIFGVNGSIKQSLTFLALLIVLNIIFK